MAAFEGKVALVTGGSEGIGLSVVQRLARGGAVVITCGRSKKKWEAALLSWPELEPVDFIPTDLADELARTRLFDTVHERYGKLDIAVNNASPTLVSAGSFSEVESGAIRETLDADLLVPLMCIQRELMLMKDGGAIVNVSSVNGIRATPGAAAYGSAKHGLIGATKALALEYGKMGLRVNAVAPGATMTPRWQKRLDEASDGEKLRESVEELVPVGRFASPDEVASAIVWLCSSEASYVVGHTLVVDGGLSQK